jgi:parvulin-like peptidyl-prolyl isomerase
MASPRVVLSTGLALAGALLLTSCTRESRVLARAGDETITVGDFLEAAAGRQVDFMVPPDSARARLLEELISQKLLLLEARRLNNDIDTVTKRFVLNTRRDEGLRALAATFGSGDVRVSESEIRRAWEWRKTESRVFLVFTSDERMATQAHDELRRGAAFPAIADRFNIPGTLPPGGDLGFIDALRLPNPLDDAARTITIGEVFGPVSIETEGYALMVVVERRPVNVPPLEELHDELRQVLLQRKQRAVSIRRVQDLIAGYRVRISPDATSRLFERFNRPEGSPGPGFETTAGDDSTVLATYETNGRAGVYTMKDALQDLEEQGEAPAWSMSAQIDRWLRAQTMRRMALIEVERRHLTEDPAVARRIERRIDAYLVESVTDPLVGSLTASDEEMKELYRRLTANAAPGTAPAYEDLGPAELNQLNDMAIAQRRREMLGRFENELRLKFPVTVDRAALARVPWPPSLSNLGRG